MLVFNYVESFQLPRSFSPSFRLRFAFPRGRGARSGRWWEAGARPGPCHHLLGAAAPVQQLRANPNVPAELNAAIPAAPGKGRSLPGMR